MLQKVRTNNCFILVYILCLVLVVKIQKSSFDILKLY